jgi:hypothetical protein
MREQGIDFQQSSNAFLRCGNPARLQELADSLTARDILQCGQKWLAAFTPFFSDQERGQAGCRHRLFFAQVELCDNLIFHRRAAVEERIPHSRRYRLVGKGYSICVAFLKLFEKSTRLLPPGCSRPSAEIACCRRRNAANSIASISTCVMT